MKNHVLKTILFFSLFLAMFSFVGYANPLCSNPANATPSNYDPNFPSSFNVTCTNANTVFITIYNSTGVLINNATMSNTTYLGNIYNFSTILPAGTFDWTFFANDSSNNWNSTNNITITINKANPNINLLIDGVNNNSNADINWTINFTAYSDAQYVNITLYSNLTGWVNQTNISAIYNLTKLTDAGIYEVSAFIFDNQNYSSNKSTYYLNVSEISPYYSNVSLSPPHNSQYDTNQKYQFNITWQDGSLDNVTFNIYNTTSLDANSINITFNSILNSTNLTNYPIDYNTRIFSVNVSDLPAGNYNYSWTAIDKFNNQSTNLSSYTIIQRDISSSISLSINPTSLPSGGGTVIASCSASSYPVNLTLNFVGFSSNTSNRGEAVYLSGSILQAININCYTSGNANYTGSQIGSVTVAATSSNSPSTTPPPILPPSSGNFSIKDLTSSLSMNAGESKPITFTLSNSLSTNLQNVNISVSGIDSGWYTLSKKALNLTHGSTQSITLTFNVPSSADAKTYSIAITAKGTLIGSTTVKSDTKSTSLTVSNPNQAVIAPSLGANNANETPATNETQNATGEQLLGPTGLVPIFEYLRNNVLIIVAIAACVLIFIFRDNVNENLAKVADRKILKTKPFDLSSIKDRLPDFGKRKSRVRNLEPEKPSIKRPEVLEREIKRDIKELQNIMESEKKMSKNKKFQPENN